MTSPLKSKNWYLMIGVILFYILASGIGVGTGILASSFFSGLDLGGSTEMQETAKLASTIERDWDTPIETAVIQKMEEKFSFLKLIPDNIFSALDKNAIIQIILFALIFGAALAYTSKSTQKSIVSVFKAVEETFNKIFSLIVKAIPLILFCIISRNTQEINLDSLLAMINFIIYSMLAFFIFFIVSTLILRFATGRGFFSVIGKLKDPIFLAIATSINFVVIPTALKALKENFELDSKKNELLFPLGVFIGGYGQALYLTFATIFAATIYDVSLGIEDYIFIGLMSIMLTLSSTGSPAPIYLSSLVFIFAPLGIPFGTLYALLLLIDFLIAPARTLLVIYPNCAFTAFFSREDKKAR